MELINKNATIIPWTFKHGDVKAWETARNAVMDNNSKQTGMIRFGGSELSTVLGINKYDSKFVLFHNKLGRLPAKRQNLLMIHGNQVEDTIIEYVQAYDLNNTDETETAKNFLNKTFIRKIAKAEFFIVADDYPCISISLDGVLKKGELSLHDPNLRMPFDTFVEIKNVGSDSFRSWNGQVPSYYMAQLQGGMAATGVPYCYFVAFVANRELWVQKVDAVEGWASMINDETIDMSLKIVKARTLLEQLEEYTLDDTQRLIIQQELYELEPNADHLESTNEALKNIYPADEGDIKDLTEIFDEELENILGRYLDINKEAKELEVEKATIKNRSIQILKGQTPIKCGRYKVNHARSFLVSKLKGI